MPTATRPLFFVHIMKTGGTTLDNYVRSQVTDERIYPTTEERAHDLGYMRLAPLLALPPERRATVEFYSGHHPYLAVELLDDDVETVTVLRDPVERTISYLKHCKRQHERHRDLTLEEIYDDPFVFKSAIRDHQAKLFAFRPEDDPPGFLGQIDVDDERLALAKEHLARVDLLGFTDRFAELVDVLARDRGWAPCEEPPARVSRERWDVTPAFRERIAEENAADVEFYAWARELYGSRGGPRR